VEFDVHTNAARIRDAIGITPVGKPRAASTGGV
jgi:hypothetical protein